MWGRIFPCQVEVGEGDETVKKAPGVLEQIAYRDTWGQGQDSFIAMIYERLSLMRDLLAEDGSIYVHCDYRVNSYIRLAMDEVFGRDNFRNEIIWCYTGPSGSTKTFPKKHDTILWYSKSDSWIFNSEEIRVPYKALHTDSGKNAAIWGEKGKLQDEETRQKYLDRGKIPPDFWDDIHSGGHMSPNERLGYPTQKPKALSERIIKASSNEGDLVADFFCGSGTLSEAAERTGRKWIASDLSRFAIHTTRKRMLKTQRDLKENDKSYRAFEILNLGKYERQFYLKINPNLNEEQQEQQRTGHERNYLDMILKAYRARPLLNAHPFHGEKNGSMVIVGPISHPVTSHYLNDIHQTCQERNITRVDVLGFEFEMGLAARLAENTRDSQNPLKLKYIPAEVFDQRVIEKKEITFYDPAYIEAIVRIEKDKAQKNPLPRISIKLKNFVNAYDTSAYNDKDSACIKASVKKWDDWIDYWSVDYDYESQKEIVRIYQPDSKPDNEDYKEQETGNYIFENEWQSFRTKQNRKIDLATPYHDAPHAQFKVAVKVVDIFGNDTMAVLAVDTKKTTSKKTTDKAKGG